MSIHTWRAEFYPIPADEVGGDPMAATRHSLQKWVGLRKENLERHGVVVSGSNVYEPKWVEKGVVTIDGESCSLCQAFFRPTNSCGTCPLFETLNNNDCTEGDNSPFSVWRDKYDPEPMITALQKTLKRLEDREGRV